MSDQLQDDNERISALVDGQLQGAEFSKTLDDLVSQPQARATWDNYQLVGQLMRASGRPVRAHDPAFVERLRRELAASAPPVIAVSHLPESRPVAKNLPASNDAWWKRVVGLASVAFLAVLVWQAAPWIQTMDGAQSAQQLAQASSQQVRAPSQPPQAAASAMLVTVDGASALMIRDPQLDALLAAQRQTGGVLLHLPDGFLRNATFNEDRR